MASTAAINFQRGSGHLPKSRGLNQIRNRAIQMTSAGNALPHRREPMLPFAHLLIGCETVLNKQEFSVRFENALHFSKCGHHIRNRAERPCRHDSINTRILQRNGLR